MAKLVEENPVDVPPVMVERQLDFLLEEVQRITKTNKDPAIREAILKLREENRGRAERQVGAMLLLEAVARKEELEASDAELEGRLNEIARENKMPAKQVRAQLQRDGRLDAVRYDIRQDKALDQIMAAAVIKDEVVTGPIAD